MTRPTAPSRAFSRRKPPKLPMRSWKRGCASTACRRASTWIGTAFWKATADYSNDLGENFVLNEYFVARPEMMLGTMRLAGRMYRDNEPTLEPDGRDLSEALAQAIARLPHNICQAQSQQVTEP